MLDINLFRVDKGGNPDIIKNSQIARGGDPTLVDQVIEKDNQWRNINHQKTQINEKINLLQKQITANRIAARNKNEIPDVTNLEEEKRECEKEQTELNQLAQTIQEERDLILTKIGNIVDDTVPVHTDEKYNRIEKVWGNNRNPDNLYHHYDLLQMIDGCDMERGTKVAGHRGYFLKGNGLLLSMALQRYAVDFLMKRNFMPIAPPLFMNQDIMGECAQLTQFKDELYHVTGEGFEEQNNKYLIATSEQPLCALHRGETLDPNVLPLRYCGVSNCFRKEAGAHGKDVRGIFRVHQFEKVEQFVIADPEKSKEIHQELLQNAEEFLQTLELPYQVVCIVTGELNLAVAKKWDIEAWFPAPNHQHYRELVSCSNCTDYQARRLNIRCGHGQKKYVHMLNSTLCAVTRVICCILENHQTPDGIIIPPVLRPYMNNRCLIPFKQ